LQVIEEAEGAEPAPPAVSLDDFTFVSVLGRGNFGKVLHANDDAARTHADEWSRLCCLSAQVMLAESRHSGQMYAVKIIKKAYTLENDEVDTYVETGVN
jgi:hypothetical protein